MVSMATGTFKSSSGHIIPSCNPLFKQLVEGIKGTPATLSSPSNLFFSPNQKIFIKKTASFLRKELINTLYQIELFLTYWQAPSLACSHKTIIKKLKAEEDTAATHLAQLHYQLTVLKDNESEENYAHLFFLSIQSIYHTLPKGSFTIAEALLLLSQPHEPYISLYRKNLKERLTPCKIPPHIIRHWKKYTALGISLAAIGTYLHKNPAVLNKFLEKLSYAWRSNIIEPITDCWNMLFETPPPFPSFESPPYLYEEEKRIYRNLHKDYQVFKYKINSPAFLSYCNETPLKKDWLEKVISYSPYAENIKGEIDFLRDTINTIKVAIKNEQSCVVIPPEIEKEIEAIANYAAESATLGPLGEDLEKGYHNPLVNIIDLRRKIMGILPRLLGLKIQQINLILAKLTDDFSKAFGYWNYRVNSLWKVLRVATIFSILPATLTTYKGYRILTKQQCTNVHEFRMLLRSIDKILTPHQAHSSSLSLAEKGLIIFWAYQLKELAQHHIKDEIKAPFIEDIIELLNKDYSPIEQHEVIERIYRTYTFLKHT